MLNSNILSITSYCIYENDLFDYIQNEKLRHIPAKNNRGDFIGAYACANFKDGGYKLEVMFKKPIMALMNESAEVTTDYIENMARQFVMGKLKISLDLDKLREEENEDVNNNLK